MGTDTFRQRLTWDVAAKFTIASNKIDAPASPDPILELACFTKPPRICFENVKVGTTKVKSLRIFNPGDEVESIVLDKFPDPDAGFAIEGFQPNQSYGFNVEPKEEIEVKISWQPVKPGSSRHLATFKWIGGQKLQFVILASAYDPNAGKKKKAKRIPPRKVLQPSQKLNVSRAEVCFAERKERLILGQSPKGCQSPNVKNLVEIAPDTPSRRATFTVTQSAFEKKDTDVNEEKENEEAVHNVIINRETFNVEKSASTSSSSSSEGSDGENKAKRAEKDENENGKLTDKESVSFESTGSGKISDIIRDEDVSIEGNTFHESEIRLSSSPIKWLIGYERFTSSKYKRELHPGQVVLNGQVKHEFIPYPSFDNTDTFLNMEMSTANKIASQDESLSFDSAASSLFTITREEKFYPNLEPVREMSDALATPKAISSESKTLTNETCAATPLPTENGWINAVKGAEDVNLSITRAEKFLPDLESVKETSDVLETPKAYQSKTLINETCGATPLPVGKGTWEEDNEDGEKLRVEVARTLEKDLTHVDMSIDAFHKTGHSFDFPNQPCNTGCVDSDETYAHPSTKAPVHSSCKDESIIDHNAQAPKTGSDHEGHAMEVGEELPVTSTASNSHSPLGAIAGLEVNEPFDNRDENEVPDLKERLLAFNAYDNSTVKEESSFALMRTPKKATFTQSKDAKDFKNTRKKEGEKTVPSRYMNASVKKGRDSLAKSGKTQKQAKNELNVIDAKFKGVNLPQKRKVEKGSSTMEMAKPGVAIKKLKLIKKPEKIAKHPMPYAAKNMFYDERWIEKQERGFKNWLNFVLTPPDDNDETRIEFKKGTVSLEPDAVQPIAPTKEVLSFRMYAARRRMAKLRRDACLLYQTDQFASVIHKLEREIEHGRLAIRSDRHVDADLGVRKHIADMLLSFNPLWLRIGLEVVYGEIIPMSNNNDASSLSRFIHRRLLGNPDIAAEYSHASVPGLFKPGYVEALGKFTLKKLILLVIYLDKAKNARLISHDPCLFNKNSQLKSIREMLIMFSRDYLHREGDIVKHLTYLGYTVSHVQTPLHEYDFGVGSLAVDLRDGLRLVRVVELLTKNWSLSSKLRVPAVSRLQKIHNVELAFQGLKESNLFVKKDCDIDARFIVDGHREKTLSLLWKIIFHFQVDLLLDEEKLRDEIRYLERNIQLMKDYNAFRQNTMMRMCEALQLEGNTFNNSKKLGLLLRWCGLIGALHGVKIENFTVSFSDGRILCYLLNHYHPTLLKKDEIRDETTTTCSMSKGGNSDDYDEDDDDDEIDDRLIYQTLTKSYRSSTGTNVQLETLLANEKHNHGIFCERVKEIGASPAMILASDMSNTIPDEKVVIAYLSFLCSRLLDLRDEIRAARCIQMAWRQHHLQKQIKKQQIFVKAATKIQAIARGYLARKELHKKMAAIRLLQKTARSFLFRRKQCLREYSATVIQQYYRAWKLASAERKLYLEKKSAAVRIQRAFQRIFHMRNEIRSNAARCIQTAWRQHQLKKSTLRQSKAALNIQKMWRGYVCRKRFVLVKAAVVTLQANFRAFRRRVKARKEFLNMKKAVIIIQRFWRQTLERRKATKIHASIVIQACIRGYFCRMAYQDFKLATIKVQSLVRKHHCQQKYKQLQRTVVYLQHTRRSLVATRDVRHAFVKKRGACITLQKMHRGRKARQEFVILRSAAVKIQAIWRGRACRQKFVATKLATCKIQAAFRAWRRMYRARSEFAEVKKATITIQAALRGYKQRQGYVATRNAVIKAQSFYRRKVERERFLSIKSAALIIQHRYRAVVAQKAAQKKYQQVKSSCIKIQAWYRGRISKMKYDKLKQATVYLQSLHRCNAVIRRVKRTKAATVTIQRWYRSVKLCQATQVHYLITKAAVMKIQSIYRGHLVRKEIRKSHNAALVIQKTYRMHKLRMHYNNIKRSVICTQRRYRATKIAQSMVAEYTKTRNAVICLQSAFRGIAVRRKIQREARAATKVQSVFRGYLQRRRYQALKQAACVIQRFVRGNTARMKYLEMKIAVVKIQRFYRGYAQMKVDINRYQNERAAILRIQAFSRGFLCRKLAKRHKAARKLQAVTRGFLQRKRYFRLLAVVQRLQKIVRHKINCKRRENAATCIQQHWKASRLGNSQRVEFVRKRQACIMLQSLVKGWMERRRYAQCKSAALVIQRRFRAHKLMKGKRREYENLRDRTVVIQSFCRMYLAKKQYEAMKKAAMVLQKHARLSIAKRRLHRETNAAAIIQQHYKAFKEMQAARSTFLEKKRACVLLQANVRGLILKAKYSKMKAAAIKLQAWYRMARVQRRFRMMKNAVLTIQRRYKAFLASRMQQWYYHLTRGAAITIQACIRGFLVRKKFLRQREATIRLQASWRGYSCKKRYEILRHHTVMIQQRVKANALARGERCRFNQKRTATIVIQRKFREFMQLKKAVVAVQARFRMLRERRRFLLKRNSCIKIQRCYRCFVERRTAAVVLQSTWRMYVARVSYLRRKDACVRIQAAVRRLVARKSYMLHVGAVLVIQRRYRAYVQGYLMRKAYENTRKSCVLIQAYVRMWRARKNFLNLKQKIIMIQKRFRAQLAMKRDRCSFVELKFATVTLQKYYRGYTARAMVETIKEQKRVEEALRRAREQQIMLERYNAATVIQKNFRRMQATIKYQLLLKNTIKLQRFFKGHLLTVQTRNKFFEVRKSIVVIQRAYRFYSAKKHLALLKEERKKLTNAASQIQSTFKGFIARKSFLKKKSAAVVIQRSFRSHLLTMRIRNEYLLQRSCTLKIQSTYRLYAAKKLLKNLKQKQNERINAAIFIQRLVRGYLCRRDFRKLREATILMQQTYRAFTTGKRVRTDFIVKRNAALKIQQSYRSHLIRKVIAYRIAVKQRQERSAVVIQRSLRKRLFISRLRTELRNRRSAATIIQRCFRRYFAKKQVTRFRAALTIQRAYRRYTQEKNSEREAAAVAIQSAFRGYVQRKIFQRLKGSTVILQRTIRGLLQKKQTMRYHAAAITIQRWYRSMNIMQRDLTIYREKRNAALLIQSCWRGYLVRRSIVDCNMIKARERIESANSEVTEPKKLCNRTKSALSYLLNCKNVSTIYEALRNLEVSTRLSTKCCERLVEDNALPVIFQIVRNCNRSLPSIEQIHMALLVLTNVAKCSTTYMAIVEDKESLQLLVELMANFREKTKIFPNCCILLSILSINPQIAQSIQRSGILSKKLKALNSLIARKAQIELKRNNGRVKSRREEKKDPYPIVDQMLSLKELMDILKLV